MKGRDFEELVVWIRANLAGKTIKDASFTEWGMGYSVTLEFTDGTKAEITPEHDEGFRFSLRTTTGQS